MKMTRRPLGDGKFDFRRINEAVPASSLHVAATTFRTVYSTKLEERFFADEKISDDDLIALTLNWAVDYMNVLGGDASLIARADRVFAGAMNAVERELMDSSNPRAKKKSRKSIVTSDLLDMAYDEADEDVDDEVEQERDDVVEDETKTPMGKLDAMRTLPRGAKQIEKDKYVEDGYGFSLLKFYSDERDKHKVAFTLARRILAHPASQSVSESTFSTHAAFADPLRTNMSPEHISMLVMCNRNHKLLFHRIRRKIKAAYYAKYGKTGVVTDSEVAAFEAALADDEM